MVLTMTVIVNDGLDLSGLKAIVFDMDGTLIRSTIDFKRMNAGVAETLLAHGLPSDILDPDGRVNESIVRAYAYFKTHNQDGWAERLENDLNRMSAEVEMAKVHESRAVDGAMDCLKDIKERGMMTAILTRGSRRYTELALTASGLKEEFDIIICRDDYPLIEAKPNPLALRRVFDRLGVDASNSLFVGDHETDLLCAKGARTPFAAVLTGNQGLDVWRQLSPDVILDSMAEIPELLEGGKWTR